MRRAVHLRQMLLMAVTGAVICLPWTLTNAGWIADFAKYNSSNITAVSGSGLRWLSNLGSYLSGFPPAMSLVLFSAWLASSTGISRQLHVRLIPLYLSLLGGILLLSTLSWAFPLDRYIAPALVVPAVMSGLGAAGLIRRQKIIFFPAICLVVATACLQYLSFFFSPRPLDRPEFLTQFSTRLGIALREYRGAVIPRNFPTPPQDWGQEWALNLIRNTDKDTPAWLNILPSTCELNPHTFSLIARERGWKVRPTTSRVWTVMGDKVTFSPETALYYRWYLLKSGAQGNQLRDSESESDYQKLVSFVRQSGRFALVGEHRIPDREKLMLYRQR